MPSASVSIATKVTPGCRASIRSAYFTSCTNARMYRLHLCPVGFAPRNPPTRALAGTPAPLRARGSLAVLARSVMPFASASAAARIHSSATLLRSRLASSICIANISAMSSPNSRRTAAGNAKRSRRYNRMSASFREQFLGARFGDQRLEALRLRDRRGRSGCREAEVAPPLSIVRPLRGGLFDQPVGQHAAQRAIEVAGHDRIEVPPLLDFTDERPAVAFAAGER